MQTTDGYAAFGDYETWYTIKGDLGSGIAPLIILHGGPGCTHDYVQAFGDIAKTGRPVVLYDQIGNGRSTHLPTKGADFWTVDFFVAELHNLIAHLGVQGGYHLLGQSWGGMLGAEVAVRRPEGLISLVIADSPASMALWLSEANRLREGLPVDVQAALTKHETEGTTDDPAYAAAVDVFNAKHVCRVVPAPPEVSRTFKAIEHDPTVYHTMNGPSEFHVIGSLKTWTIVDRVHLINVPTLLISGFYDEATPATVQPYADNIPDVRWQVFPNSSHLPHVEEKDDCLKAVVDFIDSVV